MNAIIAFALPYLLLQSDTGFNRSLDAARDTHWGAWSRWVYERATRPSARPISEATWETSRTESAKKSSGGLGALLGIFSKSK